jgi:hypothetical protein
MPEPGPGVPPAPDFIGSISEKGGGQPCSALARSRKELFGRTASTWH